MVITYKPITLVDSTRLDRGMLDKGRELEHVHGYSVRGLISPDSLHGWD